ncbi:unnamed protein product [Allacma fusca]|uniref:Uncharacterized protein n=1 Tax=Allacma fusca TaxID=39272 RepID=A0A8J2J1C5_9HEXA|nr:unnamed protein product [Allacma fusca]
MTSLILKDYPVRKYLQAAMIWGMVFVFSFAGLATSQDPGANYVNIHTPNENPTFFYSFDTENGISAKQTGYWVGDVRTDNNHGHKGCYSYTSPEGAFVSVVYDADADGYHPVTRVTYPGQPDHQDHLQRACIGDDTTTRRPVPPIRDPIRTTTPIPETIRPVKPSPTPKTSKPNTKVKPPKKGSSSSSESSESSSEENKQRPTKTTGKRKGRK